MPLINQARATRAVAASTSRDAGTKLWLDDLVREVQKLARLACKSVPQHVRADVESAAMVGLMEALRHFEEMDSGHFRRYLQVRVRGAIRDEARHFDPLSRAERRLVRKVERILQQHKKSYGHTPDMREIARTLGCDEDECYNALELSAFTTSPIHDETIRSDALTPEDAFVGSYAAAALRWGLSQLDKRDRLVLRLAYKRGLPLAVIAARLEVSTPRAHQIRVEAERRLAKLVRNSPALNQLTSAGARLDWDESTEDILRETARLGTAVSNSNAKAP
jgi:RNA polymerase sigma factor FliA